MNKLTALIIDDEPEILEVVVDQLESSGFNLLVLQASSFDEASKLIHQADIVISDINMPGKDKLETLLQTVNKPTARITGYDEVTGPCIIHKPFQIDEFESVIKLIIEQSRAA